jgi:hypothetical protein
MEERKRREETACRLVVLPKGSACALFAWDGLKAHEIGYVPAGGLSKFVFDTANRWMAHVQPLSSVIGFWRVSHSEPPEKIGGSSVPRGMKVQDAAVVDGRLYVGTSGWRGGKGALIHCPISEKDAPWSRVDFPEPAVGLETGVGAVFAESGRLTVADGSSATWFYRALDVSDPGEPTLVRSLEIDKFSDTEYIRSAAVTEDALILCTDDLMSSRPSSFIRFVNRSSFEKIAVFKYPIPFEPDGFEKDTSALPLDVALSSRHLFVARSDAGVDIIDLEELLAVVGEHRDRATVPYESIPKSTPQLRHDVPVKKVFTVGDDPGCFAVHQADGTSNQWEWIDDRTV